MLVTTGSFRKKNSSRNESLVDEQGFAMPKGVQTRIAIAMHFANKFNLDSADPDSIF